MKEDWQKRSLSWPEGGFKLIRDVASRLVFIDLPTSEEIDGLVQSQGPLWLSVMETFFENNVLFLSYDQNK